MLEKMFLTVGQKSLVPEARGDWEGQGYVISHVRNGNWIKVIATDKNGDKVGWVKVFPHEDEHHIIASTLFVKDDHRRKGIATAMYQYAEKEMGMPFHPKESADSNRTDAGKKFWSQKKRPFAQKEDISEDVESDGYMIKYIPHPGDWSKVAMVKLYDSSGNEVGEMSMSGLSKDVQDYYAKRGQTNLNYAHINWAEIKPEHRGKGLYQKMLAAAVDGVKAQGSDGVSTTAQTPESEKVWSKISNKITLPKNPGAGQASVVLREPPIFTSKLTEDEEVFSDKHGEAPVLNGSMPLVSEDWEDWDEWGLPIREC